MTENWEYKFDDPSNDGDNDDSWDDEDDYD